MKLLLTISRIIVGVLFIFSGLVKANDPLGLSYKMQEFFEVWGLHGLNDLTLGFSIVMIAFEIIAGVAVLIGWRFRLFSWLLLLLIIFFTFLTGYAVLSGKIRECGCFGDCIKLTAMDSFIKDLILLALILFLFAFRNRVRPVFSNGVSMALMALTAIASFGFQWYVLKYLPVVDCLPYKKGNNILEKMKIPPGAIPDSTVITFVYNKNGREVEFTADKFPDDFSDEYKFVKRYDKVIRKGNAVAAIRDFSLHDSTGANITEAYFSLPGKKHLLFVRNIPDDFHKHESSLREAFANTNYVIVTSSPDQTRAAFGKLLPNQPIVYFTCDAVAIKTASRAPMTFYTLNGPVVEDKWSCHASAEAPAGEAN
jgi:uncharacterized membrane protein YphA (DoxX/SURF4 family)